MGRREELKGKEDSDETEQICRVETFDDSQVKGQLECDSVVKRAAECQQGEKSDEDGAMVEGESVDTR